MSYPVSQYFIQRAIGLATWANVTQTHAKVDEIMKHEVAEARRRGSHLSEREARERVEPIVREESERGEAKLREMRTVMRQRVEEVWLAMSPSISREEAERVLKAVMFPKQVHLKMCQLLNKGNIEANPQFYRKSEKT